MQIYYDANIKLSNTAVALGQFDALHRGHIEIIKRTVKYAKENNLKALVYLFVNDPMEVICGKTQMSVNTLSKRLEVLEETGVDIVVAQKFDEEFMLLSKTEFTEKYIFEKLDAKYVAAGFNYRFGKSGEGDTEFLEKECAKRNVKVDIVPEISYLGDRVSSSRIRCEIENGNMETVTALMQRPFSVKGEVIRGNNIGEKIDFPTANMNMPVFQVAPKLGVYITQTVIGEKRYPAITNVGERPTVENGKCFIETHIDGFSGNLYGKEIEVEFLKFIREINKFESLDELKDQLNKDKCSMRNYFKGVVLK